MAQESVKLPKEHVEKVRKNKEVTGVPIAVFICQAIDEKLAHNNAIRLYTEGKQDVAKYKKLMGIRDRKKIKT